MRKVARIHQKLKESASQPVCSYQIGKRPVTAEMNVQEAVKQSDHDTKSLILAWINKNGPFMEDDRQEEQDDYFEFEGQDVTDGALGEAARRQGNYKSSGVFSFTGGQIDFERTPLKVWHGIPEDPSKKDRDIPNIWDVQKLESRLVASRDPRNRDPRDWAELIKLCQERFNHLEISNRYKKLARETFDEAVSNSIQERLSVLQQIMSDRRVSDGKMGVYALELKEKHFHGHDARAWFSDESDTRESELKQKMTSKDPSDSDKSLFCSRHAKIPHRTFRIHFQWPVPPGQARLKVVYIGPKLK